MIEAKFYTKSDNNTVQCNLCPRLCIIEAGRFGNCHARKNQSGTLFSDVYGKISARHFDPIEKKPLYHFYPGTEILSIGTTGCNFHCSFCQNFTLSQYDVRRHVDCENFSPADIANISNKHRKNLGVAFTYNEPIVNYEFMMDTAELVKANGQKTVMVTNGYINDEPLDGLIKYIDAFNIDLKGFNDAFYRKYTKGTLSPVLNTIKKVANCNKHLEITSLIIPTINDDEDEFEDMCKWILNETGSNTILHLSRYFPRYELNQYPTPAEVLFKLYDIARSVLKYVYLGNIATEIHSNTFCPHCGKTLIERTYYNIENKGTDEEGRCKSCGSLIFKHFKL